MPLPLLPGRRAKRPGMRKAALFALACAACSGPGWTPPPSVPQAWTLPPLDERLDQLSIAPQAPAAAPPPVTPAHDDSAEIAALEKKIAQFVPVSLSSPAVDKLPKNERAALQELISASVLIGNAYDAQATPARE